MSKEELSTGARALAVVGGGLAVVAVAVVCMEVGGPLPDTAPTPATTVQQPAPTRSF